MAREIHKYSVEGKYLGSYKSITDAAKYYKTDESSIRKAADRGGVCRGFLWSKDNRSITKFEGKESMSLETKIALLQKELESLKKTSTNSQYITERYDHTSKNGNVLVIGDLHLPFTVDGYLDFCIKTKARFNCKDVVFIGDIVDQYASSRWDHDPDSMSPGDELKSTLKSLKSWYNAFPEATIVFGNHDTRAFKQAFTAGIPKGWVKSFEEVYGMPIGWKCTECIEIDGVMYSHGDGCNGDMGALNKAKERRQSVVIGHGHCVPSDYEVLTNSGWRKISDVNQFDWVYGYQDNQIVIANVNDVIQEKYTGDLYEFNSVFSRQKMTSQHKLYTKDGRYIQIDDAINTLSPSDLVKTAKPLEESNCLENISDDFLRLVIAFCADGSYNSYTGNIPQIKFHFRKERKIQRLTELITNLGYTIEWSDKDQYGSVKSKNISLELRHMLKQFVPNKVLPEWLLELNIKQRQVVIDELKFWDGSDVSKCCVQTKSYQFSSRKPGEIDLIQELLLQNGILSRRLPDRKSSITFNDKKEYKDTHKLNQYVKINHVENLDVACLSTSTSNFFVRTTDGTVELTGNSFAGVRYLSSHKDTIFGMNVGCGVNEESYALAYAKFQDRRPVISCGVILDGGKQPIVIKM